MATINPSIVDAYNETIQPMWTAETVTTIPSVPDHEAQFPAQLGATYFVSKGNAVPLTFDTVTTNIDTDITFDGATQTAIGSDISLDATTGEITLAADVTYLITITARQIGVTPTGTYQLIAEGDNTQFGLSETIGSPLVITVTPAVESVYQVTVTPADGGLWPYPAGIANASIVIQAVSGYTA